MMNFELVFVLVFLVYDENVKYSQNDDWTKSNQSTRFISIICQGYFGAAILHVCMYVCFSLFV